MSSLAPDRGGIGATAHRMGSHPQDHGWRELYRLFAHGLDHAAPHLTCVVTRHLSVRPASSHSHVITMLGIAVKDALSDSFDLLASAGDLQTRLALLEQGLERHHAQVSRILALRQNSFTAARRFLVPQVLLGAYFAANGSMQPVNLADLGTGLGIMPRQLNSRRLYDLFGPDLTWPGGSPPFRAIPLAHRFGVDRGPMPDRAWVAACYGSSAYYADRAWQPGRAALRPRPELACVAMADWALLAGCLVACQTSHMVEGIIDALAIARAEFQRRLTAITDHDWGRPTPCTQWNVRQVVNHIVSHEYRYADNLATNNSEYYVASRDGDFLGEDPRGSWRRGVALLDEAVAGLDSLDTTISFLVPLPARDVLLVRVFEAAVHTWDLSRAIGFDERIDERLAMLSYPLLERLIHLPATQAFFAPPQGTLPSTATPQDRLLHLVGRTP